MSGVAIVALPKNEDPVWKYSSEKAPHLTILYLGEDVKNLEDIILFVQHAAKTSLNRFGLTVDRRGILGPDNADVLFFERDYPYISDLKAFRSYLLGDKNISLAYNSIKQYPEWTPHLTMGYPERPARKDERDYPGFHYVEFDRIAVWTGDSEGPTFDLDGDHGLDVAMSEPVEDFLAHFGVKGMRWGVRRTDAQLGNAPSAASSSKSVDPREAEILSRVQQGFKSVSEYRKFQDKYAPGGDQTLIKVNDFYPGDKRGETVVELVLYKNTKLSDDSWNDLPLEDRVEYHYPTIRDPRGKLLHMEQVEDFLAHYGIKGMRWGVRRTDEQLGNPDGGKNGVKDSDGVDVDRSKLAENSKLKSAGSDGIDNPKDIVISEDAIRFVQTNLKEGHEMSTREIQEALKRAELVAKYEATFRPDAADLAIKEAKAAQARVDTLKARAEYEEMIREPTRLERVKEFVDRVTGAYSAYSNLNEKVGGVLPDPLAKFKEARDLAEESGTTKIAKEVTGKKESKRARKRREEIERGELEDSRAINYKLAQERWSKAETQRRPDNSVAPPKLPATVAAPSRPTVKPNFPPAPPTIPRPSAAQTVIPPALPTIKRPTSDRPYGGHVPTGYGPYGTKVRHSDVSELIASFSDIKEIVRED